MSQETLHESYLESQLDSIEHNFTLSTIKRQQESIAEHASLVEDYISHMNKLLSAIQVKPRIIPDAWPDAFKPPEYGSYIDYLHECYQPQRLCRVQLKTPRISNSCLYSIGMNDDGQLGISNGEDGYPCTSRFRKVQIPDQGEERVQMTKIQCGSMFVMAIDENQDLWSWGFTECLGRPCSETKEWQPARIQLAKHKRVLDVACGEYHVVCLDEDNQVWMWGAFRTQNGNRVLNSKLSRSILPVLVPKSTDELIVKVSCGESHCVVLTENGNTLTWGNNEFSQCGRPCMEPVELHPIFNVFPRQVYCKNVWAVGYHTFWYTNQGLYGCGKNGWGELGLGHTNPVTRPTRIPFFETEIVKVSGGLHHVLFLDSEGHVFATGRNDFNQCGLNGTTLQPELVPVEDIVDVVCGKSSHHSYVINSKGDLFSCGQGREL